MKRFGLLLAVLLFLAPAVIAQVPAGGAGAIGVIDLKKVLDEHKGYLAIRDSLTKELDSKIAAVAAADQAIRGLKDGQDLVVPGSTEELDLLIRVKQAEMNRDIMKFRAQSDVQRKLVDFMRKEYDEIKREVKAVAGEKGMAIVLVITAQPLDGATGNQIFTSMMLRPVMYFDGRTDITAEVINRLNK